MSSGKKRSGIHLYFIECHPAEFDHEFAKIQSVFPGFLRIIGAKTISRDFRQYLLSADSSDSDTMHLSDLYEFLSNANWLDL